MAYWIISLMEITESICAVTFQFFAFEGSTSYSDTVSVFRSDINQERKQERHSNNKSWTVRNNGCVKAGRKQVIPSRHILIGVDRKLFSDKTLQFIREETTSSKQNCNNVAEILWKVGKITYKIFSQNHNSTCCCFRARMLAPILTSSRFCWIRLAQIWKSCNSNTQKK